MSWQKEAFRGGLLRIQQRKFAERQTSRISDGGRKEGKQERDNHAD